MMMGLTFFVYDICANLIGPVIITIYLTKIELLEKEGYWVSDLILIRSIM